MRGLLEVLGLCAPAPGEAGPESTRMMSSQDEGIWGFSFLDGLPEDVTLRVTDADGTVLKESDHHIVWTHSTERCGGPSTADPIGLRP
ncbi:hypothetical protein ACTJJ4_14210 [Microbacterium sp. 22195]|uniref:hypothetical protein n=1 Tax=Microbacterium sp. 22195 TaxID=3453891 RepID=UPI003F879AC4